MCVCVWVVGVGGGGGGGIEMLCFVLLSFILRLALLRFLPLKLVFILSLNKGCMIQTERVPSCERYRNPIISGGP